LTAIAAPTPCRRTLCLLPLEFVVERGFLNSELVLKALRIDVGIPTLRVKSSLIVQTRGACCAMRDAAQATASRIPAAAGP